MKKLTLFALLIIFISRNSLANTDDLPSECLQHLQEQARVNQIPDYLVDEIIPHLSHLPEVINYDRSQPEFTQTFSSYIAKRINKKRIKQGKKLLHQHRQFLQHLNRKYGVPGRYLVAFWGLESNFGHHKGKIPILQGLATLACDPRRSAFFTEEFLQAMKLPGRESLKPQQMLGSWAGAIGHTQFMPSTYNQYAIDGDADGKINLWQSEKDALASSANYLHQLGWNKGELWGRQVNIPTNFDYNLTGFHNWKPLTFWKSKGITKLNNLSLPDIEMEAALLVPSGHTGPAFLVYKNFKIIMHWNKSIHYALSVGLLADSLINSYSLNKLPNYQPPIAKSTIQNMQEKLNVLGYDAGTVDGIFGEKTRIALQQFQVSKGIIADGYPDTKMLEILFPSK